MLSARHPRGQKLLFANKGLIIALVALGVGCCAPTCRADSISTVDVHCSSCLAQTGIAIVTTTDGLMYSVVDNLGGLTGLCASLCVLGTTDAHGNPYEANLVFGGSYGTLSISVDASSAPIILPSLAIGQSIVESFPVNWSGGVSRPIPQLFLTASGTGTATFTFAGVLGGPLDGPMTSVKDADFHLIATPEPASLSLTLTGVILLIALHQRYKKGHPARTFGRAG
jgi:hypothetical protein